MINHWYGWNAPFLGGPQNVMSKQMDEHILKVDLIQLLMTSPGERVMRPDFGTALRTFPFENMGDHAALSSLRDDIISQIGLHEERVTVNDVVLSGDDATHVLKVVVSVSPIDRPLINYDIEIKLNK